jgi:hypothetical protein
VVEAVGDSSSGMLGRVKMIDERFSASAFEAHGVDTEEARRLADGLAEEIQQEIYVVIEPKLREIVEKLNAMGHRLKLYEVPEPGDISFRDDAETESGYKCKLRVAFDSIVSTGYAHLVDADQEVT